MSSPIVVSAFRPSIYRYRAALTLLLFFRGLLLALVLTALWGYTHPTPWEQVALALIAVAGSTVFGLWNLWPDVPTAHQIVSHLEVRHSKHSPAPFGLLAESATTQEETLHQWSEQIQTAVSLLQSQQNRRLLQIVQSAALPAAALLFLIQISPGSLASTLQSARTAISALTQGATMRVVEGATTPEQSNLAKLSSSRTLEWELLADNMIEIRTTALASDPAPVVELSPSAGERTRGNKEKLPNSDLDQPPQQSFQMSQTFDDSGGRATNNDLRTYSLTISVAESSDINISAVTSLRPVARIKVKSLPIPKVTLKPEIALTDPWPDDKPLPLEIKVHGENPIQGVALAITADKKTSRELVTRVVTEDKTDLDLSHSLILEQYVESDVAEVEIVAEAVDRSIPNPLVGQSAPLRLTIASAYGRYRQALSTLRDLKTKLDEQLNHNEKAGNPVWGDLADRAANQSTQSPFFDGLDRIQIQRFAMQAHDLVQNPAGEELLDLSSSLNNFLFEHEILDDRERDRDFFVAVRSFSRLLEQPTKIRVVDARTVAGRLGAFLTDREKRWKVRVERLAPQNRPARWPQIAKDHPFHRAVTAAQQLDAASTPPSEAALSTLAKLVTSYRAWIEELEAKEDETRNAEEQKRQQGLSSARNEIRELQKRQAGISERLDRSDQRPLEELAKVWPAARMEENTNIVATKSMEAKLRAMSPNASTRIKAAAEAMEKTLEAGNNEAYSNAESFSDLAGRLLRQAEKAASESQSQRPQRGRRRRTAGDNYYGQSVVGGDVEIKREYQVDKRYREDILNEVRDADVDTEGRKILDDYLREVVR